MATNKNKELDDFFEKETKKKSKQQLLEERLDNLEKKFNMLLDRMLIKL